MVNNQENVRKFILIGGSDGLGRAFADLCVSRGIQIVNLSRTPTAAAHAVNIKCDLSVPSDIDAAVREIKGKHADFNAIINCAAIGAMEKINEITYDKFDAAWHVNTIAPLYMLSGLFDLIKRNEADILQVGGTIDLGAGIEDHLAYVATKWGLRGGTYNFGLELKKTASRVIYIHSGGLDTQMHEKDCGAKAQDTKALMSPTDVAGIMMYLLDLPKQIEISDITINRKGRRN